jgi:gas vesicle protein
MAIFNSRPALADLEDLDPLELASHAANGTASAVREATNGTASAVRDAASDTASAVRDAASGTSEAVRDASDQAREKLTDLVRDVAREVGKASSDVRLDDVVGRLRAAVPAATIRGVMTRLERELPDTDKDRYDRAYQRGRVQTRTIFVGLGIAIGIAAGVTTAILLDPQRGPARRARIVALKSDVARQAQERSRIVVDKAKSMAAERGIGAPKSEVLDEIGDIAAEGKAKAAEAREMVPVMAVDDAVEASIPPAFVEDPAPVAHG